MSNTETATPTVTSLAAAVMNMRKDFWQNSTDKGFRQHAGEIRSTIFSTNVCGEVAELWEAYRAQSLQKPCDKPIQLTCAQEEVADILIRLADWVHDLELAYNVHCAPQPHGAETFEHFDQWTAYVFKDVCLISSEVETYLRIMHLDLPLQPRGRAEPDQQPLDKTPQPADQVMRQVRLSSEWPRIIQRIYGVATCTVANHALLGVPTLEGVQQAVLIKHRYNTTRPPRHGGKIA